MKDSLLQIKEMGERSILIEFTPEISEDLLEKLLFYKNLLEKIYAELKVEVINAYSSILIIYHYEIEDIYSEISKIKELFIGAKIDKKFNSCLFYIPVCYDGKFGIDLEHLSFENKLSVEEIISLHTAPFYTVYFIGFLPGFLYLGGLDKNLQISRKKNPRVRVEKGAIGIGENQTGIYPKASPGGWQIIGNSPIGFFDKNSIPPCRFMAGDKIKFFPVSLEKHTTIKALVEEGKYEVRREEYDGRN